MKKRAIPLLAVLLSAFAFGFQLPSNWISFTSAEGRFSVAMPQKPVDEVKEVDSVVGKLQVHSFPAVDEVAYYLVSFGDYPNEPAADRREPVLDGVRDGVAKGMDAQIVSETHISIDGYPGREFTLQKKSDNGNQTYNWRAYLVGRRVYQLASSPKNPASSPPEIQKFFNSFRLTN